MVTFTATPSVWPARAAYFSAAIFTGASGTINVTYGWQKGGDLAGSLTWAAVAAAVAIVFALSWPALIRSLEARRWSAALVALVALVLSGSYSVTAALGSAAGGPGERRDHGDGHHRRAQEGTGCLRRRQGGAGHPEARPARGRAAGHARWMASRVGNVNRGSLSPSWPVRSGGRSWRPRSSAWPVNWRAPRPAKQANSDVRTLARYLQAVGVNTTPEHLNDLLVLLAVLMIEAGGGLSLALGMALNGPIQARTEARTDGETGHPRTPETNAPNVQAHALNERPNNPERTPDRFRPITVRPPSGVVEWLTLQGGRAETSRRRLAGALGRSPSGVHEELRRLAASGAITMMAGPRGTLLALRPN